MLAPLLPIGNSTCSLSASEQIQNRKEWFVIFVPFIHRHLSPPEAPGFSHGEEGGLKDLSFC